MAVLAQSGHSHATCAEMRIESESLLQLFIPHLVLPVVTPWVAYDFYVLAPHGFASGSKVLRALESGECSVVTARSCCRYNLVHAPEALILINLYDALHLMTLLNAVLLDDQLTDGTA